MRVERGASQILFGLLPGQTADLEGRIWRVTQLGRPGPDTPRPGRGALSPDQRDRPVDRDRDGRRSDRGAARLGRRCRSCGSTWIAVSWSSRSPNNGDARRVAPSLARATTAVRAAAATARRCSSSRTTPAAPRDSRCSPGAKTHNAVAVRLPGTATARELRFFCPQCRAVLSQGFPYQVCECGGGGMSVTVHRAAVVFSPRFAVLVNPPRSGGRRAAAGRRRRSTRAGMGRRRHDLQRSDGRSDRPSQA